MRSFSHYRNRCVINTCRRRDNFQKCHRNFGNLPPYFLIGNLIQDLSQKRTLRRSQWSLTFYSKQETSHQIRLKVSQSFRRAVQSSKSHRALLHNEDNNGANKAWLFASVLNMPRFPKVSRRPIGSSDREDSRRLMCWIGETVDRSGSGRDEGTRGKKKNASRLSREHPSSLGSVNFITPPSRLFPFH